MNRIAETGVTPVGRLQRLEAALIRREAMYRLVTENVADVIWTMSIDSFHYIYVTPSCIRVSGYTPDEIIGLSIEDMLTPSSCRVARKALAEALRRAQDSDADPFWSSTHDLEVMRKDGATVWVETRMGVLRDGNGGPSAFLGVTRDISRSKTAEARLNVSERQCHLLSAHLLSVQERERREMALELHDALGQSLIGFKFDLYSLMKQLPEDLDGIRGQSHDLLARLDQILETVRSLSKRLTPPLLERAGFTVALRVLIQEFIRRHFFHDVKTRIENVDDMLSRNAQIVLYRVFQECLSNIVKHARAERVRARVVKEVDRIACVVEDNGMGFDVQSVGPESPTASGLGLLSMKERIRILSGTFDIWSAKGQGTRVTFTVPKQLEDSEP